MKKQQGFTLIELMVVMAIIAILATAGLSAYTGYIKKARDTTRIADLSAINTIILASMATTGLPPATTDILTTISGANNGKAISDPIGTANCFNAVVTSGSGAVTCAYKYYTCNSGTGYGVTALFESPSNTSQYTPSASGSVATVGDAASYDVGSCSVNVTAGPITL